MVVKPEDRPIPRSMVGRRSARLMSDCGACPEIGSDAYDCKEGIRSLVLGNVKAGRIAGRKGRKSPKNGSRNYSAPR